MMKSISLAVLSLFLASQAAMSQTAAAPKTAAECEQIWTTADANTDGKLDASEMETNKSMLPQAMQSGSAAGASGQPATPDASTSNSTTQGSGETTASTTQPSTGTTAAPSVDMTKEAFLAACTAA